MLHYSFNKGIQVIELFLQHFYDPELPVCRPKDIYIVIWGENPFKPVSDVSTRHTSLGQDCLPKIVIWVHSCMLTVPEVVDDYTTAPKHNEYKHFGQLKNLHQHYELSSIFFSE